MSAYDIGYIVTGVLMLFSIIFAIVAEVKVFGTFNKFSKVDSGLELTGAEFARKLIHENGLSVTVKMCQGKLSDHYNPKDQTINISAENFDSRSIASHAIVAHEFGHALQHANGYKPLFARQGIIVFSNVMSKLLMPLVFLGIIIELCTLGKVHVGSFIIYFAVLMYAVALIANLVTLRVEFNASNRAKKIMTNMNIYGSEQMAGVSKVLNSAALTYVASMLISLAYFLRFLLVFLSSRD